MKKQISKMSVVQNSKVLAILYGVIGLIYVPIGFFMVAFGGEMSMLGWLYIALPPLLAGMVFIIGAITCGLYNVVASRTGGFEFELTDLEQPVRHYHKSSPPNAQSPAGQPQRHDG
jgi:hypothetical protein